MKRIGSVWPRITDFGNLLLAYQKARHGHGWNLEVAEFALNLELELLRLRDDLRGGASRTAICFIGLIRSSTPAQPQGIVRSIPQSSSILVNMSHDASYKLLFSHREMVIDLLRGFLPSEWVAALDFDSLERLSGSYVSGKLQQRYSDLVWRIRWGPNWLYVIILIEFQRTENPLMASRMGAYVNLLHQDLVQTGWVPKGARLPPVLPIVLYNGQKRWTAATELVELIEPVPVELEPYQPQMRYLLIDEGRYTDEALSALEHNLVAALFRLEKGWPPDVLLDVLTALLDWLRDPAQESLQRAFTEWLKRVWTQPRLAKISETDWSRANSLLEVRDMLAERINEWSEQLIQQGLQQGIQQGVQQGERQLLIRLTRLRFGEADVDTLTKLLESVDDVEKLAVIGEWLVESADGKTFLTRVKTLAENQ